MKTEFLFLLVALSAFSTVLAHGGVERSMHPREIAKRQLEAIDRHIVARNCAAQIAEYHESRKRTRYATLKRAYRAIANTLHPHDMPIQKSTCVTAPEVTHDSYYLNNDLVRHDLRENQSGVPLKLDIGVIDTSTCKPLPGVLVELWSANATGYYSGFTGSDTTSGDITDGRNFLRGGWKTNDNGVVTFNTIYPGYHSGRTNHVHIMVHQNIQSNVNGTYTSHIGSVLHSGQIFFEETLNDQVLALTPYTNNPHSRTYNDADRVLAQENSNGYSGYADASPIGSSISQGVLGFITIAVNSNRSTDEDPYEAGGSPSSQQVLKFHDPGLEQVASEQVHVDVPERYLSFPFRTPDLLPNQPSDGSAKYPPPQQHNNGLWYIGDIILQPLKILGRGASGTVLSANDIQGRWLKGNIREVAIKVFNRDGRGNFNREIEFMQALGPTGVSTRLLATAETDHHLIVIMSKEISDLFDLLSHFDSSRRRTEEEDCKRIIKDLIDMAVTIHSRRFIHFDFKPENILINTEGEMVLCDGSFAGTWAEINSNEFFMRGTVGYMAPEVVDGPLKHPRAADMYSIGAILVWLRDVALPITAEDKLDLDAISEKAFPLDDYPIANDFLRGLLQQDPSSRMTAKEAYEHPWLAGVNLGTRSLPWFRTEGKMPFEDAFKLDVFHEQIQKVDIYA